MTEMGFEELGKEIVTTSKSLARPSSLCAGVSGVCQPKWTRTVSEPIVKMAIRYEERLYLLADAFDSEANAVSLILLRN